MDDFEEFLNPDTAMISKTDVSSSAAKPLPVDDDDSFFMDNDVSTVKVPAVTVTETSVVATADKEKEITGAAESSTTSVASPKTKKGKTAAKVKAQPSTSASVSTPDATSSAAKSLPVDDENSFFMDNDVSTVKVPAAAVTETSVVATADKEKETKPITGAAESLTTSVASPKTKKGKTAAKAKASASVSTPDATSSAAKSLPVDDDGSFFMDDDVNAAVKAPAVAVTATDTSVAAAATTIKDEDELFSTDVVKAGVKIGSPGDVIISSKVLLTKDEDDFDELFGNAVSSSSTNEVTETADATKPKCVTSTDAPINSGDAVPSQLDLPSPPSESPASASSADPVVVEVQKATVGSTVGPTDMSQFSEEFDDLFGTDLPAVSVTASVPQFLATKDVTVESEGSKEVQSKDVPAVSAKPTTDDDDLDFLSWLGDASPPLKSTASVTESTHSAAGRADVTTKESKIKAHTPTTVGGALSSPTQSQSKVKAMMDVFFDDLFGGQERQEVSADRGTPSKVLMTATEFETRVKEAVSSSFSDSSALHSLLLAGGYVPCQYRAQVWCVLLTGSCTSFQDAELKDTQRMSALASVLPNIGTLLADCEAAAKSANRNVDGILGSKVQEDMQDILILYCSRREKEYSTVLCHLLSPLLLGSNSFSKEMASFCFYTLASVFAPLLSLDNTLLQVALSTVHSWLRLLVMYHSPAAAQHLDRVLPGWEVAADMSGQTSTFTETAAETESESGRSAGSDSPGCRKKESWGIPLHWMSGMFCGSLPPDQSCFVIDWSLISKQRYAGVYLIAALIELYSGAIVTMTGDDIRTWLLAIASGQKDWYTLLPLCLPHPLSSVDHSLSSPATSWSEFTCGWVHAATALQLSTPIAFQQALCDTELWLASRDYTTLAAGRTSTSDTSLPSKEPDTPATSETHSLKIDVDRNVAFSGTINEDSLTPIDSPVNPSQSNTAEGAAVGVGLLDRFKLLGSKIFTAAAAVRAGAASATQMESRWPHESKVEAGTMCVWSNAGEVVPFISSSSRTALPPFESIHCYFQQGVLAVSGVLHEEKAEGSEMTPRGKGRMILPPQTELLSVGKQVEAEGHGFQSDAGVTYFGIDCRNERERSLGLFPRTYCIDPAFMSDTDHILKLLVTLEPLATSLHLCIIGAGDDYFRATYQPQKQGKLQELDSLQSVIADDRARLNAVAMFFLKRSFPHVSILDGGFVGAVKHLREADPSLSLSIALADASIPVLEAVLSYNGSSPVHVPVPGVTVLSIAARIRQSVGEVNTNLQRSALASSLMKSPPRSTDATENIPAVDPAPWASKIPLPSTEEGEPEATPPPVSVPEASTPSATPSVTSVPAMAVASSYFGGIGKKMTAFGASSFESVRNNIAAAQLAHQQQQEQAKIQQELAKQQQQQQGSGGEKGAVLWSPDVAIPSQATPSSSSSSVPTALEGGLSFMGGLRSAIVSKINTARGAPVEDRVVVSLGHSGAGSTFVIDEEEDEEGEGDDGMGPREEIDPHKICVSKTDLERSQALAMHVLAGLKKGDSISISRESLPGAVLFPGIKYKEFKEKEKEAEPSSAVKEEIVPDANSEGESAVKETGVTEGDGEGKANGNTLKEDPSDVSVPASPVRNTEPPAPTQVHRFLVVTRERFIVLDSGGSGIGSTAIVKSNHHLTELLKMTFRKSDPELICLYLGSEGKMRQYRVSRRKEFVDALQKNMMRFK